MCITYTHVLEFHWPFYCLVISHHAILLWQFTVARAVGCTRSQDPETVVSSENFVMSLFSLFHVTLFICWRIQIPALNLGESRQLRFHCENWLYIVQCSLSYFYKQLSVLEGIFPSKLRRLKGFWYGALLPPLLEGFKLTTWALILSIWWMTSLNKSHVDTYIIFTIHSLLWLGGFSVTFTRGREPLLKIGATLPPSIPLALHRC